MASFAYIQILYLALMSITYLNNIFSIKNQACDFKFFFDFNILLAYKKFVFQINLDEKERFSSSTSFTAWSKKMTEK